MAEGLTGGRSDACQLPFSTFNCALCHDQNTSRLRDWRNRAQSSSSRQYVVVSKELTAEGGHCGWCDGDGDGRVGESALMGYLSGDEGRGTSGWDAFVLAARNDGLQVQPVTQYDVLPSLDSRATKSSFSRLYEARRPTALE